MFRLTTVEEKVFRFTVYLDVLTFTVYLDVCTSCISEDLLLSYIGSQHVGLNTMLHDKPLYHFHYEVNHSKKTSMQSIKHSLEENI